MTEKNTAFGRSAEYNLIHQILKKKKFPLNSNSKSFTNLTKTDRRLTHQPSKQQQGRKQIEKNILEGSSFTKYTKMFKYIHQDQQIKKFGSSQNPNIQLNIESIKIKEARKTKLAINCDIGPEIPKLRETKSTNCQSPKGNVTASQSKANQFIKINVLGKGKFGRVYLVRHRYTGFIAALKVIRKIDIHNFDSVQNEKAITQLIRQIKIQLFLQHPNLIKLYDFFSDQENIYLLQELGCDGELYELLKKQQKFSEQTTSMIVRELVEGINYMHERRVIHRDLKLENVVFAHGMAKICDFGWSVYCPKQFRSTLCGTPLYLSPQILKGKSYNQKIDTWAIGALTHELSTSQNPFQIQNKEDLSKIITEDFEMKQGSPQLRSFITFILKKNPAKRPDADTLKRHPFIKKYEDLDTSQELCSLIYGHKEHECIFS